MSEDKKTSKTKPWPVDAKNFFLSNMNLKRIKMKLGWTACDHEMTYIYELRTKLLVWGNVITKCGGPLSVIRVLDVRDINIKAGACNLHSGMIWFATWSSKPRCASSSWQQMQITIKYSNAPSFILVTLPIGTYPVGETMKLEGKGG